ncbi:hypothetical protein C8F04DRAFT_1100677 [Mycena alexandri]|uniref:Uncharacterized protein n=1 Tax=Mycena alexandri TaxID=1745969 RepID=A0AAD6SWF9_9AGAR|nr:hypothetical protein C8F04DRAFT_1100677 [Mycena alexandri]
MHWNFRPLVFLLPITSDGVQFTQVPLADSTTDDWDLNAVPNPNATGRFVFDTVASLLQHWSNTRYHSGHNIIPGTIPTGTLLYHGRQDSDVPTTREWASFDSEFARIFCAEPVDCWFLTLVTTRPLRVLYFDGSSATKNGDGPIDTQDLLTWGAVLPERAKSVPWDYERLHRLCDLGDSIGIDAYIRMQANFEVMLCNFTDGLQTVTLSRLEDEERFPHHAYNFLHASAWYDHYPGETRIQLDLTQLVSLYDVEVAPSLVSVRYGQERRAHRVLGIDERDVNAVLQRVRAIPSATPSQSGIDWSMLFKVIRDRYATRLEVLQNILATDKAAAPRAFVIVKMALSPYRLYSAVPPPTGSDTAWAAPVFRLCAQSHTSFIESIQSKLTTSEYLLLTSAQETTREICRILVGMWAEGVINLRDSPTLSESLTAKWKSWVDGLMSWLDWSLWTKCRPACEIEVCALPSNIIYYNFNDYRRSRVTFPVHRSPWRSGMRQSPAVFACLSRTLVSRSVGGFFGICWC